MGFRRETGDALKRLGHFFTPPAGKRKSRRQQANREKTILPPGGWLRWTAGTAGLLLLAAEIASHSVDRGLKPFLQINYDANHQQWAELLSEAGRLPSYSPYTSHDVDLALYHTGRLPDDMFAYPQTRGIYSILFDQSQVGNRPIVLLKPCNLLLELGQVNEAEHLALEMLEMRPSGTILARLAWIKMIKGQPDAARLFLNVLRDDLVWGRWAETRLCQLDAQPGLEDDPEIRRIRSLMLPRDDLEQASNIDPGGQVSVDFTVMLSDLWQHNPKNRMALEYLMALDLLQGNLQGVVDRLPQADTFFHAKTPACYAEAALLHGVYHWGEIRQNSTGLYFRDRKIDEATAERLHRLLAILERNDGSIEKAAAEVIRELPRTYFAYYADLMTKSHD
jgi:hypothetical protein